MKQDISNHGQVPVPVHTFFKFERLASSESFELAPPHRHGFYEIFLFEEGGGTHLIDEQELEIQSRSLHFVHEGQIHQVKRIGQTKGSVLMFSESFLRIDNTYTTGKELRLLEIGHCPSVVSLAHQDYIALKELIYTIGIEYEDELSYRSDMVRILLRLFLLKVLRLTDTHNAEYLSNESSPHKLVRRFRELLETNYASVHKVRGYAELLAVTPNYLNNSTQRILGKSAGELIQARIVLEAKRLLLHSSQSNKEVAYTLNFNDPSYFSRFFKKHTGYSPNAFKKYIHTKT